MKKNQIRITTCALLLCMCLSCGYGKLPTPNIEEMPHWFLQYKNYANENYYIHFLEFINNIACPQNMFEQQMVTQYQKTATPFWTANGYQEHLINEGVALLDSAFVLHGIPHEYFDCAAIHFLIDTLKSVEIKDIDTVYQFLAQLEWKLTNAIIKYANALQYGATDPKEVNGGKWLYKIRSADTTFVAQVWAAKDTLSAYFQAISPADNNYKTLQKEFLKYYVLLNQPFQKIAYCELDRGATHESITALIHRLQLTEELETLLDTNRLTDPIIESVNKFRIKNAIPASQKLDLETITALNRDFYYYIKKLAINMERLRWRLEEPKGQNYIAVNFADFSLKTIMADTCAIMMKVCCGKSREVKKSNDNSQEMLQGYKLESPMLQGYINQIILFPEWNVPSSIMENEYYHKLKKDAQIVLSREKMYLVNLNDRKEVDPSTIDWNTVKKKQIPYQLVQTSGYHNSLGVVKFNFPNPESVYLHDTPNKKAFHYRNRDVSHGCIRVERPLELMQLIFTYNNYDDKQLERVMIDLGKAPTTTEGKLYQENLKQKEKAYKDKLPADKTYRPLRPNPYNLKQKLPVYLEYYTCFVNDNGDIHYRNDIYEKDDNILKKLKWSHARK